MQFFLADLYADRLSGSDAGPATASERADRGAADLVPAADEPPTTDRTPVLSGGR